MYGSVFPKLFDREALASKKKNPGVAKCLSVGRYARSLADYQTRHDQKESDPTVASRTESESASSAVGGTPVRQQQHACFCFGVSDIY